MTAAVGTFEKKRQLHYENLSTDSNARRRRRRRRRRRGFICI